jgi:hypothetical protein
MKVTEKDEKIYKFIEENGFATVKQIANVFYSDILYGSTLAKKRLDCLVQHGYIKQTKSVNCSQHVFYALDKNKRKTKHAIIVMDLYSRFLMMKNLEVLNFEREKCFANNKVIADGFLTVKFSKITNVIIQSFLIEVQTSNNDYTKVLGKYNDKEVFDDVNNQCGGYAPLLIYVDDVRHNMANVTCPYQICQIDENLSDFPLIFDQNP